MDHSAAINTTARRVARPVRLNVPGDLALYTALAGKEPVIDPTLANPLVAARRVRQENPWSPTILSIYLREMCRERALKLNKPELTRWIKRQTEIARKRFAESQNRITAVNKRAA